MPDDAKHEPVDSKFDVVCSCSIGERQGQISWTAEHYERAIAKHIPISSYRRTPFPKLWRNINIKE